MPIMVIAIAGIVGALLGPGLRAIIFVHSGPADVSPRRCCPTCGAEILPYRPTRGVSVFPLSGRCPACRDRIGPPPGGIEIITSAVFVALALRVTSLSLLTGLCWLAACGIALAVIDATAQRLPNTLVGSALIGLLSALAVTALAHHQPTSLLRAVLGGITLFIAYTALAVTSDGMGFGDCKLAAVLGTALGWFSWTALLTATVLSFLASALHLLARRSPAHASHHAHIPFGPALLLGTLTAILMAP